MRRSRQSRGQVKTTRRSDVDEQREYFDTQSPTKHAASVDTKTVGIAGIIMFLATNFKSEIKMIIEKIFGN